MEERLKNNIAILKQHNLSHIPVFHITDGKKHEVELIDEIVEDCEKIFKDEEQGLIKRFPCKVGDRVYSIWSGLGQDQTVKADTVWHFTVRDKVYITTDYIEEGELGVDVFLTEKEAEKKLKGEK